MTVKTANGTSLGSSGVSNRLTQRAVKVLATVWPTIIVGVVLTVVSRVVKNWPNAFGDVATWTAATATVSVVALTVRQMDVVRDQLAHDRFTRVEPILDQLLVEIQAVRIPIFKLRFYCCQISRPGKGRHRGGAGTSRNGGVRASRRGEHATRKDACARRKIYPCSVGRLRKHVSERDRDLRRSVFGRPGSSAPKGGGSPKAL